MHKTKLIYFFDALCGWCYGFSPVMKQLHERYKDQYDFEIISGGLVLGKNIGPLSRIADYIKNASKEVEQRSTVTFGENFLKELDEGSMILNSVPPAVALCIVKDQQPDQAMAFGALLQHAMFYDGMHPENILRYSHYAAQIGMDKDTFNQDMQDDRYIQLAKRDFKFTRELGIEGYPALVGMKDEQGYVITRGFRPLFEIEQQLLVLG